MSLYEPPSATATNGEITEEVLVRRGIVPLAGVVERRARTDGAIEPEIFEAELDWKGYAMVQRLHLLDHRTQVRKIPGTARARKEGPAGESAQRGHGSPCETRSQTGAT